MPAAAFRLLSFVALTAAASALWVGFVHSTGSPVTVTPPIPPVGSQSIFVPSVAAPGSPPAGSPGATPSDGRQGTAGAAPPAPGLTVGSAVTSHACSTCAVRVMSGGVVRAQIPAGAGRRHAYALLDLGDRAADGHVLAHDVIAFGRGEAPARPLSVLQLLDTSRRVIFELVARSDRRLYLESPAGGLRGRPLDLSTGATVPNDGISGVAVDISAKANESLAVYVNGVRTISRRLLAGATTTPPRFLAAGVISYAATPSAAPITAIHTQVSVSTATTAQASPVAVTPAPSPTPNPAPSPAPTPAATPPLSALAPPTISGRDIVGSTLRADPGSWSDPTATFAYAWQRCDDAGSCTTIDGATAAEYTLVRADRNAFVRVRVWARAGDTKGSKVSAAVGPVMRAAPSALAPPQVSGEPVVGKPLTADAGTWSDPQATFTFVWQRCDETGVCTAIDGATGPGYTPSATDLGESLRVEVTATNAGGTATVDSGPTRAVVPAPPVVATAPTVQGDTTVGSTLTADPGSWSDPTVTFAYAWQRCDDTGACTTIDGATGSGYRLTGADVGFGIAVTVTATGGGGTATAGSVPSAPVTAPVPVPPAPNGLPTLSGATWIGSTLAADPGSWSDPAATFAYAWQRCDDTGSCTTIDGATGSTYVLGGDDAGLQIRVEVTATGVQGTIGRADSTPVGPVVLPAPPAVARVPAVSGDATVGSTLTADPGSWSGPPPTLAYAWQECQDDGSCSAIDGATESAYALTAADLGRRIRVEITATNAGGAGSAVSPTVTIVLPPPPAVLTAPSVSGDATVGSTLTADPGSWSGPPTTPGFSWQRCDSDGTCSTITGAANAAYTITNDDLGQRVRVRVTATNAGGKSVVDSATTDPVILPDPPSLVTAPGVSGDPIVGATLTATPGSWTGPPPAITYDWQSCDDTGSCNAVANAAGATYAPTGGDVGRRIRVQVTATNAGGSGTSQSAATEPVAASQAQPAAPEPGDATPSPAEPAAGPS